MAYIEKCCEYSGEYPGWKMYGYKHNQLQIMPEYRKLFRHQKHVLVISKSCIREDLGGATCTIYDSDDYVYCSNRNQVAFNKFKGKGIYTYGYKRYSEIGYLTKKCRILQEYYYMLYVPNLQGEVEGFYLNWSYDIKTVKRKLKRMLKTDINVFHIDAVPFGERYVNTAILEAECVKRYNEIYGE